MPTADLCPDCGDSLGVETVRQDALLRGGGYGGTQRVETLTCATCGHSRVAAVQNERPPR